MVSINYTRLQFRLNNRVRCHRCRLAREGIVKKLQKSDDRRLCVSVCPPTATARRISLGGKGNALYPVLSTLGLLLKLSMDH